MYIYIYIYIYLKYKIEKVYTEIILSLKKETYKKDLKKTGNVRVYA
jgi:hypothetical protein